MGRCRPPLQEEEKNMSVVNSVTPRLGELYSHTAIRGVAAISVVGFHALGALVGEGYTGTHLQNYFLNSFIFVDFFFILSGFIMFENYGHKMEGSKVFASSIQYWKKRIQKILPNYYFWLIIGIILTVLKWIYTGERSETNACMLNSTFKHIFLIQNLGGFSCYYFNFPLWSIAVEIIAYIFFPFIIMFRATLLATLSAGIFLYLLVFIFSDTINVAYGELSVARCLAGFLCGIAAAKVPRFKLHNFVEISLAFLLIGMVTLNYQPIAIFLMFIITLATANNTGTIGKISQTKLPYLIGRASFSIYLAHFPVAMVLRELNSKVEAATGIPVGTDWRINLTLVVLVSGLVGIFAYAFIERRFEIIFSKRKAQHGRV